MSFNQIFRALLKEAQFTNEILGAGATQIRKANYSKKGIYFQSFTSLSTGIERIGKLCLMLDFYIENDGEFPALKYLKSNIGHDLIKLYAKSLEITDRRSIEFEFLNKLENEVHQNILNILSNFSKGDRYSNINLLAKAKKFNDPILNWHNKVDTLLYEKCLSAKKKESILNNADMVDKIMGESSRILHISESDEEVAGLKKASELAGIYKAIAPYRQLYVLQILRYWTELISNLQYHAMKLGKNEIPFFSEIFAIYFNTDSYFKTRKTWNKI